MARKHAASYRDLEVYQLADEVARALFKLSRDFPREELYSLTAQMLESSRSVGAQIAEAWAKRRYRRHFILKLSDADAEQQETQHWIRTAVSCGYLTPDAEATLLDKLVRVGRMLHSMMRNAHRFCDRLDH